jgi:hypothetical protein
LVADCSRLLRVEIKYFRGGGTSGNTGNRRDLCFFRWKGPILISSLDSTLKFYFGMSFCEYWSVIIFDLCHLFRKEAGLQGCIKKL